MSLRVLNSLIEKSSFQTLNEFEHQLYEAMCVYFTTLIKQMKEELDDEIGEDDSSDT